MFRDAFVAPQGVEACLLGPPLAPVTGTAGVELGGECQTLRCPHGEGHHGGLLRGGRLADPAPVMILARSGGKAPRHVSAREASSEPAMWRQVVGAAPLGVLSPAPSPGPLGVGRLALA